MPNSQSIEVAAGSIRKLWEKHGIQEPMRFLGFCLSLLPVPGIQAAGQAIDRHLGDKAFKEELKRIWEAIKAANEVVSRVSTLEEGIKTIAETLEKDQVLMQKAEGFMRELSREDSRFTMLTEQGSYQELVHSIVTADIAQIIARERSTNVIENTKVQASETLLHATDASQNFVNKSTFSDGKGSVGMEGITTQGNIRVAGSSVGLGAGSALILGGNPNLVSGDCPSCHKRVQVDRRQLTGYSFIECPHCKARLPFSMH